MVSTVIHKQVNYDFLYTNFVKTDTRVNIRAAMKDLY